MPTLSYACLHCGCQAAVTDVTLVEAMGWLVLPTTEEATSLPCVCAVCQRAERRRHVAATRDGAPSDVRVRDAHPRSIS